MTGRSLLCGIGPNGKSIPVSVNAAGELVTSSSGGGTTTPAVTTPMLRQNVTGTQANYYTAIAPAAGEVLSIHSVSLLIGLPVPVTFLSVDAGGNFGPVWATFDNAATIEPPFKQPYALPLGSGFVIRLNNGEDSVRVSGSIEYKRDNV